MLQGAYAAANIVETLLLLALYLSGLFVLPVAIMCPFFAFASQCRTKVAVGAVSRIQALCFLISLWVYLFLHRYAPLIMPFKPELVAQVIFQVSILFPISCILCIVKAKPKRAIQLLALLLGNGILALIFTGLGLMLGKIPLP
jgi:hypothetical protein